MGDEARTHERIREEGEVSEGAEEGRPAAEQDEPAQQKRELPGQQKDAG